MVLHVHMCMRSCFKSIAMVNKVWICSANAVSFVRLVLSAKGLSSNTSNKLALLYAVLDQSGTIGGLKIVKHATWQCRGNFVYLKKSGLSGML